MILGLSRELFNLQVELDNGWGYVQTSKASAEAHRFFY
jgi:hypothetical protein